MSDQQNREQVGWLTEGCKTVIDELYKMLIRISAPRVAHSAMEETDQIGFLQDEKMSPMSHCNCKRWFPAPTRLVERATPRNLVILL
jgi:hypothetical protein